MQRLPALVLASSLLLASGVPVFAHSYGHRPGTVSEAFRLQVAGHVSAGETFWVAYGPLNGRFAILRLHQVGAGRFVRNSTLPVGSRATYSYIMGHGVLHTRLGAVPGNPVVTIRAIGPVTVGQTPLPTIEWYAPIG